MTTQQRWSCKLADPAIKHMAKLAHFAGPCTCLDPHTYRLRVSDTFQAIQYVGGNIEEVRAFVKGRVNKTEYGLRISFGPAHHWEVEPNDYIVRVADDDIEVFQMMQFEARYCRTR